MGGNDDDAVLTITANPTAAERTATIIFTSTGGTGTATQTLIITQAAAARAIAFSSSSLSADVAAGTKDVTITSNSDFRVTTSDTLVTSLTFTPVSGSSVSATPSGGSITLDATGDGTLAVAYSANDTIVERTGTLTLSAKNGSTVLTTNPSSVTTTLTQAAAARAIAFSSSSLSADVEMGTKDVTITSNSDWRVTTSDVLVTSLTFTPTMGNNTTATPSGGSTTLDATGDGTLSVAYLENTTTAERTGTLTLSALDGSSNVLTTNPTPITITLTQEAAPVPTLTLTASGIVSPSGSEENYTYDTDAAQTTLNVVIAIENATGWRATKTADTDNIVSLANDPSTGGNGETLTITIAANPTVAERTATIIFTSTGGTGTATQTLIITQAAGPRTIAFSSSSLSADAAAGTKDVTITSNSDWQVTTSDVLVTSLTFTPTTGNNTTATPSGGSITLDATGDGTLVVAYSANGTPAERIGTIIFTSTGGTGTATQTLIITQAAGPRTIAFSTNNLSADVAAGTKDVTITSNSDWRVTTSDVLVTSLTFTPVSGFSVSATPSGGSTTLDATGDGTLSVAYLENTTTAERTATLTLSALDGSSNVLTTNPTPITITLTQEAAPVPTLTLTASGIVPPLGSEENYTYDTDAAQTTLNVVIAIENATGWSATETADTDNIVSLANDPATGGNGDTLAVVISENTTLSQRTATLTFTSTGGIGDASTQTLVITQLIATQTLSTLALAGTGVTAPSGEATNYTADAPAEQSTLNVDVTLENATGWAVRTTADFVNLPNSAMGGNDDDAELTITANPTVAERTATIIFTSTGGTGTATQTLIITQAAGPRTIAITGANSRTLMSAAGTEDIIITSNSDFRVTTSDVLVTSLTFTPTTGNNTIVMPINGNITLDATGDGTLSVAYSANGTIVERTGTLTLSARNGSTVLLTPTPITITLTQEAASAPTLTLAGTGITAPSGSEVNYTYDAVAAGLDLGVVVAIENATGWRATKTADTDNIVSLANDPSTGGNGETLTITIAANPTVAERTATIIFTSTGGTGTATQTLIITQAAGPRTIAFSTNNLSADVAAGTKDVTITSNSDWRVTTSDVLVTSLTFTPVSGFSVSATPSGGSTTLDATGDGTLSVAYLENTTTAERTATLTLSALDGSSNVLTTNPTPITITLTQEAAPVPTLTLTASGIVPPLGSEENYTYDTDAAQTTLNVVIAIENATGWSATETADTDNIVSLVNDPATGGNGDALAVVISENTTLSQRTATLTFTSTGGIGDASTRTLIITQLIATQTLPTLTLSGTGVTAPSGEATNYTADASAEQSTLNVDVTLENATGWAVRTTADFVNLPNSAMGGNDDDAVLTITANPTVAERTATIIFTSTGGTGTATQTLIITQAAGPRTIAITGANSRMLMSAAGTEDIIITSNSDFRVTTSDVLVTSLTFTPTTGNNTIVMPINGNITLDATGDGTLSVAYSANATTAERIATLTLSARNGSTVLLTPTPITITLTQEAAPVPTLTLAGTGITAPSGSEVNYTYDAVAAGLDLDVVVAIENATGWRATKTADTDNIVSLANDPSTGGNGETLTITIAANPTVAERTGTIIFTSTGGTGTATQTLIITQAAGPRTIAFSTNNLSADVAAGTKDVTITSNSDWRVTTSDVLVTSLTFTSSSGSAVSATPSGDSTTLDATGNGTLVVAYSANGTTAERTGTLTLSVLDGSANILTTPTPIDITLTQAAASAQTSPTLTLAGTGITDPVSPATNYTADAVAAGATLTVDVALADGATTWTATITGAFVTSAPTTGGNDNDAVLTIAENTTTAERTATITFVGTGGSVEVTQTLIITQAAAVVLPTLTLSGTGVTDPVSPATNYTADADAAGKTLTVDVTLTDATGWAASTTADFVTSNPAMGGNDDDAVLTIDENTTFAERMATITLITTGHEGTPDSVSLTITQGARADTTITLPPKDTTTTLYSYTRVNFSLYPNPTKGTLTIEGVMGHLQMYIHDLVGREVMTYSLTPSNKTIDVSNLPSGMYAVTLQGEDKTWTEVLIIDN